tara:strand:- start:5836 stop:6024 length:189 start_codon:yes stop_codon:yes gene_type:complete
MEIDPIPYNKIDTEFFLTEEDIKNLNAFLTNFKNKQIQDLYEKYIKNDPFGLHCRKLLELDS